MKEIIHYHIANRSFVVGRKHALTKSKQLMIKKLEGNEYCKAPDVDSYIARLVTECEDKNFTFVKSLKKLLLFQKPLIEKLLATNKTLEVNKSDSKPLQQVLINSTLKASGDLDDS